MLIKFEPDTKSFQILDYIDSVTYSPIEEISREELTDRRDFWEAEGYEVHVAVARLYDSPKHQNQSPIFIRRISFIHKGKNCLLFTDRPAFLLNDQGKTVEVIKNYGLVSASDIHG